MTAGNLPRTWISGFATAVVKILPAEEQSLLRRQASVRENEFDVLRDIFPIRDDSEVTYTTHNAAPDSSFMSHLHSQEDPLISFRLDSCAHSRNLSEGMLLHHHMVSSGLDNNFSLCDHLARMYGRCDSHNDALYCFDNMGDRSISMWSFMIGLHFEQKRDERTVIQLFQHSLNCNAFPDTSILLFLISSCKDKDTFARGKHVHVLAKSMGCEADVAVGTALLSMYSRCKNFKEAKILFDMILEKDVVTWNAMIATCVQHENTKEALHLFMCMQQEGLLPNIVTFISAASACSRELDTSMGKSLHIQASYSGLASNVSLASAFVSMYGKLGSIENACNVFQDVRVPCVILWTGMLSVYSQHGHSKQVFYLFSRMQVIGILPNEVTFLCLISTCNKSELVATGKRIHAQIMSSGIECNIVMSTALAVMYGKCRSMEESDQVFSSLADKSIVTWSAMILMCADSGQSIKGIQLFSDMQQQGISPDKFTFANVLHACACLLSVFEGKKVHQHVLQTQFRLDVVVCNALIDMYSKCRLLGSAQLVFDGMRSRNTASWNTLMAAYAQSGYHEKALIRFNQMQDERICPDAVTFASILSALAQRGYRFSCWRLHNEIIYKGFDLDIVVATNVITMYGRYGSIKSAQLAFDRMCERDDSLWSAMLGQHDSLQAFQILDEMRNQGFIPGSTTLASCLSTSSGSDALMRVRQLHVSLLQSAKELNETQLCALICTYAECGDLQKAWSMFNPLKCDLILWNCMIGALAAHGKGIEALELFKEMKQSGISPDETSSLNALSACSHFGLVEDAFELITPMRSLNSSPLAVFHYDCIVDLLGRVGQLSETMFLIGNMPFKPTPVTWTSLLGACTNMTYVQGGECAANFLLEMSQEGFVPYILLSRMYFELNKI